MKQSVRALAGLIGLAMVLVILTVLSLSLGPVTISIKQWLAIICQPFWPQANYNPQQALVISQLRLPRVLLAIGAGVSLGGCGAAIQGLFRNPLADPGLIGISSGAALGGVSFMLISASGLINGLYAWGPLPLLIAAFAGSLGATWLIKTIAQQGQQLSIAQMLLASIGVNAIIGALIGLSFYLAPDGTLRQLIFWTLGSLSQGNLPTVLMVLPVLLIPVVALCLLARPLNVLLLGESAAQHLGVGVERVKGWIILGSALAVGAAVALTGIIAFVGLVAPHISRLLLGPDHRYLIPGASLLGASLLLAADLLARSLAAPAELPIGILTALIGGPFFLYLLIKQKKQYRLWQ
jgi:iron complex transport system permease protein